MARQAALWDFPSAWDDSVGFFLDAAGKAPVHVDGSTDASDRFGGARSNGNSER
jgi:hypothetical protein